MRIGLLDVDGSPNFPNLCLMKLSAWHKKQGDTVEWWNGFARYDMVYKSKVFTDTYTPDIDDPCNADRIVRGGTGYGLDNRLPDAVEHSCPDYTLYPQFPEAYGFLTRGCPRRCGFCIVSEKEGTRSQKVADLLEFWRGQKDIRLLDPNLLACPEHEHLLAQLADSGAWIDFTQGLDARLLNADNTALISRLRIRKLHFAWDSAKGSGTIVRNLRQFAALTGLNWRKVGVYILTNYDTVPEFDLHRVYALRDMGLSPYVMVYDKPHAPLRTRQLQRWCNCKPIWRSCLDFADYVKRQGHRV